MTDTTYTLPGCRTIPDATKLTFWEDRGDPRHGTVNGYGNLGCRCQPCRDSWASRCYLQKILREARTRRGELPASVVHGTTNAYGNWGCRCPECLAWSRENARKRRKAVV